MIKVIAFVFSIILPVIAGASKNPLVRVCEADGGSAVSFYDVNNNEYLVCRYGIAFVEANTLLKYKMNNHQSAVFHMSGEYLRMTEDCWQWAGRDLELKSDIGYKVNFCRFDDGSIMSHKTMLRGIDHIFNRGLKKALDSKKVY